MTFEDRLRRALHTEAEAVDTDDRAWETVQAKVARRGRLGGRQRLVVAALATAAMIAIALGAVALLRDDGGQQVDAGPPVATDPATPTTTEHARPAEDDDLFPGIWPLASEDEVEAYRADSGAGVFFDAAETAREFARVYLGMPDPQVVDAKLAAGDGAGAGVSVRAAPGSPMLTRIELRRFGGTDGAYSVTGATTDSIVVDRPAPGGTVSAGEAVVAGRSTAFEATVQVEVRQDGQAFGENLGRDFVMGGSMGDLEPFAGAIAFDEPSAAAGAVVFYTDSAEDGSVQGATVVRVAFSDDPTTFSVFFHRGEELVEVRRTVPKTAGVLRAALRALFEGPQPDDGHDLSSLFSADTADLLAGVNLRPDGTAVVDLAGTVPNANTSAGSQEFLAELDATVFQFETVERIEYRLDGSCDAFWEWLQYGPCQIVTR